MEVKIEKLSENHLFELWDIIKEYPNYFEDGINIKSCRDLVFWYKKAVVGGVVGIKDGRIIGCGYLDYMYHGMGSINLFMRRKAVSLPESISVFRKCIEYFTREYNLNLLYGVIRETNKACLYISKALGFTTEDSYDGFEMVNGEKVPCILVTYIPRVEHEALLCR